MGSLVRDTAAVICAVGACGDGIRVVGYVSGFRLGRDFVGVGSLGGDLEGGALVGRVLLSRVHLRGRDFVDAAACRLRTVRVAGVERFGGDLVGKIVVGADRGAGWSAGVAQVAADFGDGGGVVMFVGVRGVHSLDVDLAHGGAGRKRIFVRPGWGLHEWWRADVAHAVGRVVQWGMHAGGRAAIGAGLSAGVGRTGD